MFTNPLATLECEGLGQVCVHLDPNELRITGPEGTVRVPLSQIHELGEAVARGEVEHAWRQFRAVRVSQGVEQP